MEALRLAKKFLNKHIISSNFTKFVRLKEISINGLRHIEKDVLV